MVKKSDFLYGCKSVYSVCWREIISGKKCNYDCNSDTMRILRRIKQIIMNRGTVKFFNVTKGFGFIKDAESNNEYFVHVTGLVDEIQENDEVTFELKEGRKGLNAVNVKLV